MNSTGRERSHSRGANTHPQQQQQHQQGGGGGGGGGGGRPTSGHSQRGGGGGGEEGAYVPPRTSADADFDFCNAFWLTPQRSRANHGREETDEERDWGKEGYETVLARVRSGTRGLEELRGVLKERAAAADDYAKRIAKISKHPFGTGETGHMERAIILLKSEHEVSAKSHNDLATVLREQEGRIAEFVAKREAARKNQQLNIEKTWKQLQNQRQHVLKAKAKYEEDAIQINALHAQASLLQGRELDKASLKLDKVQQTVAVNERDYRNYVAVLKETTTNWNMAWKQFCDLVQDQEEERLEFLKSRMWDFSNGVSSLAMAEDESSERTRTALEQCDPKIDVRIFVQQFGTGNCIPDPIPFHDVSSQQAPPRQGYKTARFQRSSARIPGVTHSPSAVQDINRAIGQVAASAPSVIAAQRRPSQPDLQAQQRPPSRSANYAPSPAAAAPTPPQTQSQNLPPPVGSAPPPSTSHDSSAAPSPGRFVPSPSGANLRHSQAPSSDAAASPFGQGGSVSARPPRSPGHISAGAFQNRQSMVSPSPSASAFGSNSTSSPAPHPNPNPAASSSMNPLPTTAPSSPTKNATPASPTKLAQPTTAAAEVEDEDDPLVKAMRALATTPIMDRPRSRATSTTGPLPGGFASPLLPQQQRSSVDLRAPSSFTSPSAPHHRSQSSLSVAGQQPGFASPPRRAASPGPIAAMMQPPQRSPSPNMAANYGAAFPGERRGSHSRAGSSVSSPAPPHSPAAYGASAARPTSIGATLASPPSVGNFRSSSPSQNGFRSASPQPFIPESLRPASPNPQAQQRQQRAASPQPQPQAYQQQRPNSAYGGGGSQVGAPAGRPLSSMGYAAAPSPHQQQQSQYGAPVQQQQYGGAAAPQQQQPYSATTVASPAPFSPPFGQQTMQGYQPTQPHQQQQQQRPPSIAQAPSQHFQQPPQQQQQQQQPSYSQPAAFQQQQQLPPPHPQHAIGANGYAYPVAQPPPAQQQYQQHQPPSSAFSSSGFSPSPAGSSVGVSPHPQQQQHLARTPSTHSGVSGVSAAGSIQHTPARAYGQPPQQQQQQQVRAPSVAAVREGTMPPPPPTGQYTDLGVPIIFYVTALFDYAAPNAEEFSFSMGDVIAVTETEADGWWKGNLVGAPGESKLFPSNFTELLH